MHHFCHLLLAERGLKRWCAGREWSAMFFLAFLIILVEKGDESEGRLQPMNFDTWRTTLSSLVLSGCATKPDKHGKCERTFNG